MGKVAKLQQLTESQKREYISELLYRSHSLDSLAVDHQLSHKPTVVSHIEIQQWARNDWPELYRPAIYHQFSLIILLIKKGGAYNSLLDELFLLGRNICNRQQGIDDAVKIEILAFLLETGLKLYDNKGDSLVLKYDLQYQLQWPFRDMYSVTKAVKNLSRNLKRK